ncbi:Septin-4 [Lamellibrachia satsuma]|nr:Septin-4 [Lamellibrachia satsuma]
MFHCSTPPTLHKKGIITSKKASIPFAVIGSNTKVEVNGKKVRGRLYPWGIVEVDNPDHCDFTKLRQMLISTHMQDLKDMTRDVHYENYRAQYIKEHLISGHRERTKLKRESTLNIDGVQYTDHLLQAKEDEIQRMQQMLSQMKAQLDVNNRAAVNGVGRP